MMTASYEDKLAQIDIAAKAIGKRLEECLIGDRDPSAERVESVYRLVASTKASELAKVFGDEVTLERMAAEGVMISIISSSNFKVIQWRIESKARSCACALMDAKRTDVEGLARRDQVYKETFGAIWEFVTGIIPEDPQLGYSFARPIMDQADAEVKASQLATRPPPVACRKPEQRRAEAREAAEALGKRLEESLVGGGDISDKRIKEVYDVLVTTRIAALDKIFGKERTLEKIAAEGVMTAIVHDSHEYVQRDRIERKARSCASALMQAKRTDHEGIKLRGKVYDDAYGAYHRFVRKIMADDPDLGMSYGKAIMEAADKEAKASWKATKT